MAWIIDTATDPEDRDSVGITGPRVYSAYAQRQHETLKNYPHFGVPFRLLDDDHELIYTGRITTSNFNDNPFQPLQDYGTPNAGCTIIQYMHKYVCDRCADTRIYIGYKMFPDDSDHVRNKWEDI